MKRVDRYLAGVLLMGALPVLMLLLGLFGFVTLAEELEDVGKGRFEDADALRVALLTLPRIAIDLLPVAALLGGVMALGNLAGEQELTVLRAAGMSQWRLAYPLFVAAMLLSATVLLAQQYVVPRLEHVSSGRSMSRPSPGSLTTAGSIPSRRAVARCGRKLSSPKLKGKTSGGEQATAFEPR